MLGASTRGRGSAVCRSTPTPPFCSAMDGGSSGWVRGQCLGRGSTAAVYLAASSMQQGYLAVKSAELSRSVPLQWEREILSSLCSPHVVSCFGSDVTEEPDGRVLYNIFLEYVPGGSLADAVKKQGGLDCWAMRLYTRGILDGLAYLHGRGIVHCDVKGHNVLVGADDGTVKLADFGCAKCVVDDGSDNCLVVSGTPLYMAPEVARGEEQGPAADIWALGCTVIEMVTGYPPWRGVADPIAVIHRIAFSSEVPEIPSCLPDDARDFLFRCLDRDPNQRWSAEELLNHPFVDIDRESTTENISKSKGISPKSTLEQDFWDSWPEDDDDYEGEAKPETRPLGSVEARLKQLTDGVRALSPPSTVDENSCWITVRTGVPSDDLETTQPESPSNASNAVAEEESLACCGGDQPSSSSTTEEDSAAASLPPNPSRGRCDIDDVTGRSYVTSLPGWGPAFVTHRSLYHGPFTKRGSSLGSYADGAGSGCDSLHESAANIVVSPSTRVPFRSPSPEAVL